MDAEKALSSLGNPWSCPWTITFFFIIAFLRSSLSSWNFTGIVFLGAVPDHHCRLPSDGAAPASSESPVTSPNASFNVVAGSCYVYSNVSSGENATKQRCPNGWQYEGEFYSMVNEWDLVCDRDYLADVSQVLLNLGCMIGALFLGHLADRFGRRKVLMISSICAAALTLCSAWVPDFYMLLPLRFFVGMAVQGVIISGYVYLMETFPSRHRCPASTITMVMWGVCMICFAGLAHFIPHWRHLMVVMALPGVLVLPVLCFSPESIPWLLARNEEEKAREVLYLMARRNGKTLNIQDLQGDLLPNGTVTEIKISGSHIEESVSGRSSPRPRELKKCHGSKDYIPSPTLLKKPTGMFTVNIKQVFSQSKLDLQQSEHLVNEKEDASLSERSVDSDSSSTSTEDTSALVICRNAKLRLRVFVLSLALVAISLSFFGLSLNTSNLAGNVYLNFALSGLMEVVANLVSGLFASRLGRKPLLSSSYLAGGLFLGLTVLIPATTDGDFVDWATVCLAMIGKFFCSMGYSVLPLYLVELFPTTVRSLCIGTVYFVGRTGAVLAPLSTYMTRHVWWFSGATSGLFVILAGLLLLILPETNGRRLPQNISEMEEQDQEEKSQTTVPNV